MTAAAGWMMVGVCGFVWGGFALLLGRALRHEGRKTAGAEPPPAESDERGSASRRGGRA